MKSVRSKATTFIHQIALAKVTKSAFGKVNTEINVDHVQRLAMSLLEHLYTQSFELLLLDP